MTAVPTKTNAHSAQAGAAAATLTTYTWAAPYGGAWGSAGNWQVDGVAAPSAPNTANDVVISGSGENDITGAGTAGALTIAAETMLFGSLAVSGQTTVGTNTTGGYGSSGALYLDGATLTTSTLDVAGDLYVQTGSHLQVSGMTLMNGPYVQGQLVALDGGTIQLGSLIADSNGGLIGADAASSIHIGTHGTAVAGAVTIDAGLTAVIDGAVAANLANNGRVAVTDGGYLSLYGSPYNGASATGSLTAEGSVSGLGTLVLNEKSVLTLDDGSVTNAIQFNGPDGDLNLSGGVSISGAISGFAEGDTIGVGSAISGISWNQSGTTGGVLTLREGGVVAGHLDLSGNYTGDVFVLIPGGSGYYDSGLGGIGGGEIEVRHIGTAPAIPSLITGTAGADTITAMGGNETLTGGGGGDSYMASGEANITIKDTTADLNGATIITDANAATLRVDVTDLAPGATELFTPNEQSGGTSGVLTLSDTMHSTTMTFETLGAVALSGSSFSVASDGHGGALVTIHT